MRHLKSYASIALALCLLDASAAFAQDGSRIVMRRPLDAATSTAPSPGSPTPTPSCGGPGNPCAVTCDFSDPSWNAASSDPNVCTGSVGPANATCMATNESGTRIAVPDSLCLEDVSSYLSRCPSFSGIPSSGPVAGVRPQTVPGTKDCSAAGVAVVIAIGQPRVASGSLGNDGNWRIMGYNAASVPVCSYPTAAPATVECRVNGVPSSPSNCSVETYSNLYSQNLVPVSPGGNDPVDIRQAEWVRPGFYVGGCTAQWKAVDDPVPSGCGGVTVNRTVTCEASNPQSGSVPEEHLTCDPSTRPSDSYITQDYRSCTFAMEGDPWSDWSDSCGVATRSRQVYCRRSDGQGEALNSSDCASVVSSYCASLPSGVTCGSQTQYVLTVNEVGDRGACPDPNMTTFHWEYSGWGPWSTTCGTATHTRTATCANGYGTQVADSNCSYAEQEALSETADQTSGCPTAPPPPPANCTAANAQVTGDTCEGGTLVGSGEYHQRSATHPGGNFSNGTREESTGMTSELACAQAGGNCWQVHRLPHTEYGEWDEINDYFECHADATSISPNGSYDGLPNNTDPEYFDAGFLQCTATAPDETTLYAGRGYGVQGTSNCPSGPGDPESTYSIDVTTPPAGNVAGSYVRENRDCFEAGGTRMEFTITQCTYITDNYRQDYDEGGTYKCLRAN